MKAQDFIVSLPDGLFTHFQGMEAEGNFEYNLNFKFNKTNPINWFLIVNWKRKPENHQIRRSQSEQTQRWICVSRHHSKRVATTYFGRCRKPELHAFGSNFTLFAKMYFNLRRSVVFRIAVLSMKPSSNRFSKIFGTKILSWRASTISMQLIKNVFLTREKTVSRKLEEILLVYILENNRIASKERMLEVYFNIIEWGPNVYGIGEAAQFYFQKKNQPIWLWKNACIWPLSFRNQRNLCGNLTTKAT